MSPSRMERRGVSLLRVAAEGIPCQLCVVRLKMYCTGEWNFSLQKMFSPRCLGHEALVGARGLATLIDTGSPTVLVDSMATKHRKQGLCDSGSGLWPVHLIFWCLSRDQCSTEIGKPWREG